MIRENLRTLIDEAQSIVLEARRVEETNFQERFNQRFSKARSFGNEQKFVDELYTAFRNHDVRNYDYARLMVSRARKWLLKQ